MRCRERGQTRGSVLEEALSVSLLPHLILSDTVLSLWCQLARRFLSVSLTLSATLASTLVRPPERVPTALGFALSPRACVRLSLFALGRYR